MIIPGLTSVTFRKHTPQEVVNLALKAGLKGIEWGGDIHVPVGYVDRAEKVGRLTRDAGLTVSAYGSYYTVGKSRDEGIRFADVLQIADEAGRKGISLAFEFHENTLNDTYEACSELLTELAHPVINTYWQPIHGAADWKVYFNRLSAISRTIFGNIEFVKDDDLKQFLNDAKILLSLF